MDAKQPPAMDLDSIYAISAVEGIEFTPDMRRLLETEAAKLLAKSPKLQSVPEPA